MFDHRKSARRLRGAALALVAGVGLLALAAPARADAAPTAAHVGVVSPQASMVEYAL